MKRFKLVSVFICIVFLVSTALTAEIPEKRNKDAQAKQEEVSQDEVKQEEVKQDEVSQDVVKQEDVKQEDTNQDDAKQDEVKQDEVKQDEVKQDEVKQDDVVTSFRGHSLLEAMPMTDEDVEFLRTLDETVPEDVLDFWSTPAKTEEAVPILVHPALLPHVEEAFQVKNKKVCQMFFALKNFLTFFKLWSCF